jgi:hypothetical protein
LLGEIVHALPLVEAFSGKLLCRKENARFNNFRVGGSRQPERRVAAFSNSGNPGRQQRQARPDRLYIASLEAGVPEAPKRVPSGFLSHGPDNEPPRNDQGGTGLACNQWRIPGLYPATFNNGDLKMSNQNQPGQQNQNPGQKPGQQQGGGQKPGQQQQDPNRQAQNPNKDHPNKDHPNKDR